VRKILIGFIVSFALTNLCYASDVLSDLTTGIPGIKWGEKLSQRGDMVWNEKEKHFLKTGDNYILPLPNNASMNITKIWYYHDKKGEFSSCILFAAGDSFDKLKMYVKKRYGEPKVSAGHNVVYIWKSGLILLSKGFDGDAALTIKRPPPPPTNQFKQSKQPAPMHAVQPGVSQK
jgi:hypothetical protein